MDKKSNIIITGAVGFIGSCLVRFLNDEGYKNLILVDDFSRSDKDVNLAGKDFQLKIEREDFFTWLVEENPAISFVYHIGARTDTTEFNYSVHEHLNLEYSKKIWNYCATYRIPLVYASSAATYGAGEKGYSDSDEILEYLKPLNPYGVSKNEFDKWAIEKARHESSTGGSKSPPAWAGLKFFNVYGPNEYHKGRMASMVFHSYNQIIEKGFVKLFKSHKTDFNDGEQLRDFIYVKDVLKICLWFLECWSADSQTFPSGIYNVGTGAARTFNDLVKSTFYAAGREPVKEYIKMPADIRDTYQYYTQAEMKKLRNAGYKNSFYTLEEGVEDYVKSYLPDKKIY